MADLHYEPVSKTIMDLMNLYRAKHLNLEPGFQRDSVWSDRDRELLIDSIIRGWPLPSIFLYRREHEGHIVYDVIDGKQRIESVLRFTGQIRGERYSAKVQLPGADDRDWADWSVLKRRRLQHLLTSQATNCRPSRSEAISRTSSICSSVSIQQARR